jgi:imidazolonepropionase-like amidohydrolase
MLTLLTGRLGCACCVWPLASAPKTRSRFSCSTPSTERKIRRHASLLQGGRSDIDLVITHANVVDTHDGALAEDVTVLISRGQIVAFEDGEETGAFDDVERIDGRGKFVTPGFNDMHSHVLELANPSGALALMLAEGVTGFRQMSGSPERLAERRDDALPIGAAAPALLQMPGTVLTPMNAGSPEAAAAEVRAQKAQGADFIKVGFVAPQAFMAAMAAANEEAIPILGHLQDGVDVVAAVRGGFRCVEHLGPDPTVWIACSSQEDELKAEARTLPAKIPAIRIPFLLRLIQRRMQMILINPRAFASPKQAERIWKAITSFDEAKFQTVAARFCAEDTWHCPTLVRLRTQQLADAEEYAEHPDLKYMPDESLKRWRRVTKKFKSLPRNARRIYANAYPRQMGLAKALGDQGVRLIAGTDGGWLSGPGLTLQAEFVELGKAGFTPLQVLQMATINAAEYLGREQTMGRVAPGFDADLVILDADPRLDVVNLSSIAGVVRAGTFYSKAQLDGLRQQVEEGRGYLN